MIRLFTLTAYIGILAKSLGIKFSKILILSVSTDPTYISHLFDIMNDPSAEYYKTTSTDYLTGFLRVRNLGRALLGGSGFRSLMRLQTVSQAAVMSAGEGSMSEVTQVVVVLPQVFAGYWLEV